MSGSRADQKNVSLVNADVSRAGGVLQNDRRKGSTSTGTKHKSGTDCRCAAYRAPAGDLRVRRNFKQNDLFLVILPQAEGKVCIIKVTCTLCRHMRFVLQQLFKRKASLSCANVSSCLAMSVLYFLGIQCLFRSKAVRLHSTTKLDGLLAQPYLQHPISLCRHFSGLQSCFCWRCNCQCHCRSPAQASQRTDRLQTAAAVCTEQLATQHLVELRV